MNVLITAIGSFSADCVIHSLKERGNRVVGCDIYPAEWHAESQLCDNVYRAPYATDEGKYIDFLLDVCTKEGIDYLIPLTDLEIDVINRNRNRFSAKNIFLCIQPESVLAIARDKYAMYTLFENDVLVNVPYSVHSDRLSLDFPLPAIAKPVNGRSSEGLMRVSRQDELSLIQKKDNYIIQEMLEGPVFTVDYVRDSFGNDFSVPREELLRTKNGAGTTIRITPDKNLVDVVSYIGNKIGIVGCVNMEFILHDGKYYLIDINPRFSAGVAFSNFLGYDMALNNMLAYQGKRIDAAIEFSEQIICKHYSEVLLWKK